VLLLYRKGNDCGNHVGNIEKRIGKVYDLEGLELSGQILEMNQEYYTAWNYRRELYMDWENIK
jgi:hypothetical protein